MIVGISHITLACHDVDGAVDLVSDWGYRPKFIEKGVLNNIVKSDFLSLWVPTHDIAYCEPVQPGLPLELISYGRGLKGCDGDSPYIVAFSGLNGETQPGDEPADMLNYGGALTEAFGDVYRPRRLDGFNAWCYGRDAGDGDEDAGGRLASIRSVLIRSVDIERSIRFWSFFSFAPTGGIKTTEGVKWGIMRFKVDVFSRGVSLLIVQPREAFSHNYNMDAAGFACLAVFSTNIVRDARDISAAGFTASGIFAVTLNGNRMDVCLCRSDDGSIVELLQKSGNA
jgi:hypothetical protein